MTPQEIKDFLKLVKDTDIEEMRYKSGENSFYFKKSEVGSVAPLSEEKSGATKNKKEEEKSHLITIKSKSVGTFISFRNNDKTSVVTEGDKITVGQKIGQIEAMKIIKDITSNYKGKIMKVLVSNGQPVGYGQELFLLDTSK
jgi:biotin carboxyl carrier protein